MKTLQSVLQNSNELKLIFKQSIAIYKKTKRRRPIKVVKYKLGRPKNEKHPFLGHC